MIANRLCLAPRRASLRSWFCAYALILVAFSVGAPPASAQFVSGSDGSCGAYNPTTSGYFIPSNFPSCHHLANNVFDFTTITIPAGVTITLTAWYDNAPVYWLASGNVDIEGTLNLAGGNGANWTTDPADYRIPPAAGSGGYTGGVGGSSSQPSLPGSGPGGGKVAVFCSVVAGVGTFTGNQYLVPLVGGSGGGGGGSSNDSHFTPGGGAGGGAILIASTTQITVNGTITANGGSAGTDPNCGDAEGGSGGAIHLVSSTINGSGTITAVGGTGGGFLTAGSGMVRLEAYTLTFAGSFAGTPVGESVPFSNTAFAQTIPSVPRPFLQVTSVNGQAITENPFGFPDTIFNTDQPVPVVITGHKVPVGTTANLTVLGDSADQDSGLQCTLAGTLATSTCTINVTFAFGGSRGLYVSTWQNPGSRALQKK
jgi:hypothetical protein